MCRQVLKDKITSTFHIPVYDPANGHVQYIETLSAISRTITIADHLYRKRARDIAEAAETVAQATHLPPDERLDMLMQSVTVQGKPEAIQYDGYLFWAPGSLGSDPVVTRPVLMDGPSFLRQLNASSCPADGTGNATKLSELSSVQLETLIDMRHYVRRFFRTENALTKIVQPPTDDGVLTAIHTLLIRMFHPQICVARPSSESFSIHSIEIDDSGRRHPCVVLDGFRQITPKHTEYTMRWCVAGERIAKAVIKAFQDTLE